MSNKVNYKVTIVFYTNESRAASSTQKLLGEQYSIDATDPFSAANEASERLESEYMGDGIHTIGVVELNVSKARV